jgi:predicted nucleic acid-binding protein
MRLLAHDDGKLAFWWGTPVECSSSFARLRREGAISTDDEQHVRRLVDQLTQSCTEISPSEEVRATARRLLLRHPLRAADTLQLAAALVWSTKKPDDLGFVCLDKRLRDAARIEGFTLFPQELQSV